MSLADVKTYQSVYGWSSKQTSVWLSDANARLMDAIDFRSVEPTPAETGQSTFSGYSFTCLIKREKVCHTADASTYIKANGTTE